MKKWQRVVFTAACIVLGNAILAFLVAAFIIPHDIIMGGTTGIGIVLNKITGHDTALFIFILNILLLLVGLLFLGRKLFMTTVASSLLYPMFLAFFQKIPGIMHLTDDHLLAALFAGVLMGISLGLVMRVGSSTGGMDIICLLLNKHTHISVSIYIYLTDFLIIGGQALTVSPEKVLLGILVLVLESLVLDRVMILGQAQMQLSIVSEHYEKLRDALLFDLEAGVTLSIIETGLLGKNSKEILCVIPPRKLYQATEMLLTLDPDAFITVTKINEVRGKGFTSEREYLKPERRQE